MTSPLDVSLTQLRMLKAVAEAGTLGKAASALGYTSSAVSQQMSALGKSVGEPVLERIGRNVRLTDVGAVLVERASVILGEMETAQAQVEQLMSATAGRVCFGYVESMTTSILLPLVRRAAAEVPGVELYTVEQGRDGGVADLLTGRLDIATVIEDELNAVGRPEGLVVEWLRDDLMHLAVPKGSDLLENDVVKLGDLAGENFVMSPSTTMCGLMAWSACRQAGFEPITHHVVDLYPVALQLVEAGAGVAIVPELCLGDLPDGVRVLPLSEPVQRRVGVSYRESSATRPALVAVLDLVRSLFTADPLVATS